MQEAASPNNNPFADTISTPNVPNFDVTSQSFKDANKHTQIAYTPEQIIEDSKKYTPLEDPSLRRMTGPQVS